MIVVEGPDNAGKSTLIGKLSRTLGWNVYHPGGPPANAEEFLKQAISSLKYAHEKVIQDRSMIISDPVYSTVYPRNFSCDYHELIVTLCVYVNPVIIYCRPPDEFMLDFSRHEIGENDDENQLITLHSNMPRIIQEYDMVMLSIQHIKYDHTSDNYDMFEGVISNELNKRTIS